MNREVLQATEGPVSITLVERAPVDLLAVFSEETRILKTLISEVLRQRAGVADHDLSIVDETVHGTQRILLTLGEARQRRRTAVRLMVGEAVSETTDLEPLILSRVDQRTRQAWAELKDAAGDLSRELEINRKLLEEAIEMGENFVKTLYGATTASSGAYTAKAQPTSDGGGGLLVNRRV